MTNLSKYEYYRDSAGIIYCGDCLEILPLLDFKSIVMLYADPPFNTKNDIGLLHRKYKGAGNDNLSEQDYDVFCKQWFWRARCITTNIVLTPGLANIGRYPNPMWHICIEKKSSCAFNRFGGFNVWEDLIVYHKPKKRIPRDLVEYDARNFIKDGGHLHPCADNLDMVKWIVDTWSLPAETILDPFIGSGSLAIAAKTLGRKFIAIDICEKYCELTKQRLAQEMLL